MATGKTSSLRAATSVRLVAASTHSHYQLCFVPLAGHVTGTRVNPMADFAARSSCVVLSPHYGKWDSMVFCGRICSRRRHPPQLLPLPLVKHQLLAALVLLGRLKGRRGDALHGVLSSNLLFVLLFLFLLLLPVFLLGLGDLGLGERRQLFVDGFELESTGTVKDVPADRTRPPHATDCVCGSVNPCSVI